MARVFLVNPPSPEPVRTPLLSFCHLAAALRAAGHEVALLDASAPYAPHDHAEIAARIAAFAPELIGLHLKTLHVQPAYALAADLASLGVPLVAGGPHATIVPDEPFAHGFAWVIRGEGEDALVELADVIDGKRAARDVAGLSWLAERAPKSLPLAGEGRVRHNPPRPFISELDRLAPPLSALDLFDPRWYAPAPAAIDSMVGASEQVDEPSSAGRGSAAEGQRGVVDAPSSAGRGSAAEGQRGVVDAPGPRAPAGILSSRGCPAACTFCSNDVTGRKFRYRSAASVAAEVALLRERFGLVGFSFFDDSFAVGKRRVRELCAAIAGTGAPVWWTCTAHPSHLDPDVIADMQRAGCAGIDIGMESADPGMLVRIGKGVTVERVLDVLGWCRDAGVHCVVNLMFGWPDETDAELASTIDFLERAAPIAGGFNARGVVVPYPGTEIYERHHARYGFTQWWLREPPLAYTMFPTSWAEDEIRRAYADDPALDRNFFHHPPHRLARIRAALARKAELTIEIQHRRLAAPVAARDDAGSASSASSAIGVPAAGAR